MATTVINGTTYNIPVTGSSNWGDEVSALLKALGDNNLQTGASKTLSAELDTGATFSFKSVYFKDRAANPADAGFLRIANTSILAWRNAANSGNLVLGVNASDRLTFGTVALPTISSTDTLTNKTLDVDNNTVSNIEVDNLKTGVLDTDLSSVSANDDTIPSAKATKTALDGKITRLTTTVDEALVRFNGVAGAVQDYTSTPPTASDTGILTVNNATEASNSTTAALVVAGGIAVAKKTWAAGDLYVDHINEITGAHGVNIDGTTIKDSNITLPALNAVGLVHNDASGVLSTSLIVDADVKSDAAVAWSKLAAGSTKNRILQTNSSTGVIEENSDTPASGEFLKYNGTTYVWDTPAGAGDTVAPATNVAHAIASWDASANSKTLKTYSATSPTIDDNGIITIANATDATSSAGALVVEGGVCVKKKLYVGTGASIYADQTSINQLELYDTGVYSTSPYTIIQSSAKYNTAADYKTTGQIRMGKANATDGNYESYISFLTRADGVALSEKMRITGDGKVGIGATSPTYTLDVKGSNTSGYIANFFNDGDAAACYGIQIQGGKDDGTGTTIYIQCNDGNGSDVGYIQNVSGTFQLTDVSDRRLKTNIENSTIDALSIVDAVPVVNFNRIKAPDGPTITGFIAQDVQAVFPHAVSEGQDGFLGLSKENLVPVLWKAVQEQSAIISTQEGLISALKDSQALLEARVASQDARLATLEGK